MSSFDERKKGFEKKFAHDEEKQFKINARKNKYLGEWASQVLGYDEEKKNQYIQDVIKADFAEAGDEDVYRKLYGDLKDKNTLKEKDLKKLFKNKESFHLNSLITKNISLFTNNPNYKMFTWLIVQLVIFPLFVFAVNIFKNNFIPYFNA